ncbi:MAG: hypothetical protein GY722_19705 [bacterium]|nr:hypothetical protein [bacterium]
MANDGADLILSKAELRSLVRSVIRSDEFLSVLGTALPRGEKDEQYGFDHIPFLLKALDDRRKRFEKTSKFYLVLTLILGVVASVLVVTFGYWLIDESAVGDGRAVRRIERNLEAIKGRLEIHPLTPLAINERFKQTCETSIQKLWNEDWGDAIVDGETPQRILGLALDEAKQINDVTPIVAVLDRLASLPKPERERTAKIEAARKAIGEFTTDERMVLRELPTAMDAIAAALPGVAVQRQENRIAEILKRLSISLIVVTFFIAILRFFSKLYTTHLREVLQADRDELAVRRFYVGFRCAQTGTELSRVVLAAFMNDLGKATSHGDAQGVMKSEDYGKLLKDIVNTLAKKV